MKKSSKPEAASSNINNCRIHTLHQRLFHALTLALRFHDGKKWRWKSNDIETQKCVVRAVASFLDCASEKTHCHPLLKESVSDIVEALAWILQYNSDAVTSAAASAVVKLVEILPNAILQSHSLDLVHPLASLLSSQQFEASLLCATALNTIFTKLSVNNEDKVFEILNETKTVYQVARNIQDFPGSFILVEYFQEMASLLSTILQRWPPTRYPVWNDAKVLDVLEVMCAKPDLSVNVTVPILKLYIGIALCGNGAKKLLEGGEGFLHLMVLCMGKSQPLSMRIEGFKLAQCLSTNEKGCSKMMSLFCEPIVKAIIDGMSGWTMQSGKLPNEQLFLLIEACRLALIVRWRGEHQKYFLKHGIDKVLLNLLLENSDGQSFDHIFLLEEQISKTQKGLRANFLLAERSYVWEILRWLSANCSEDFNPEVNGHDHSFKILILCASLSFADSIQKSRLINQHDVADSFRSESVSRAVLMMIYSPCKYISSEARFLLLEILKSRSNEYPKHLLRRLNITSFKDMIELPNVCQIGTNLVALVCYIGLPHFQSCIIESGGIKTLLAFLRWRFSCNSHLDRLHFAPHLYNTFSEKRCCWICEEWEDDDLFLFYGIWGLAELLYSGFVNNHDLFADMVDYSETQFVSSLQEICLGASAPGLKWCSSYLLCYFGFYGFPSKMGMRICKALNYTEYKDVKLILANEDCVSVHGIILATRSPFLLPPEVSAHEESIYGSHPIRHGSIKQGKKFLKEIRLSSHVDEEALNKLLEFVYLGYLCTRPELVRKLKILAKHCGLLSLSRMLCRRHPKWGIAFPVYDLAFALSPVGHSFSDIILEADATKSGEFLDWKCPACSSTMQHIHAHKVVLTLSSDYLRAMFQSGMQESNSQIVKVPVSWEAMSKLVHWFYTGKLPDPPSGCLWNNMDIDLRVELLQPYLELLWLSELWLLDEVRDISYRIIVNCLDSSRHLSIKILKISFDLNLWRLVEVAANYLAPLYRQLCHSGDLEILDEKLVDIIREASVLFSHKDLHDHCN